MAKNINCRVCSKSFNVKGSIRVYGDIPASRRCCSARCYTEFLKGVDNDAGATKSAAN